MKNFECHLSPEKGTPYGPGALARAYPCANVWASKPSIVDILNYLDVCNAPRYKREPGKTFCNVYAHDFLHLSGLYIPRVWWEDPNSVLKLVKEGVKPTVRYGVTVREMNANALTDWASVWGSHFGWKTTTEANIQASVDKSGRPGFIVACAPKGVGHISVVLPTESVMVYGKGAPIQSQAGASNDAVFRSTWYKNPRHGFNLVLFCYQG